MKLSQGFSKLNFSIYIVLGIIVSFYFLEKAITHEPSVSNLDTYRGNWFYYFGGVLFKDHLALITLVFVIFLIIGIKITSDY